MRSDSTTTTPAFAWLHRVATVYVLACCVMLAYSAHTSERANWDMLGYAAVIEELTTSDPTTLHAQVYADAREYLTPALYADVAFGDEYRTTLAQDPILFSRQIPYYRIRVAYLTVLWTMREAGIHIHSAASLISAISAALACWLLFLAFRKEVDPLLWLVIPVVLKLTAAQEISRLFTADALSFLCFAALYYLYRRGNGAFFILLTLSVLVRTDLLIVVLLCAIYIAFFRPQWRWHALISFVLAYLITMLISNWTNHPGWASLFYFNFMADMEAPDPSVFAGVSISPTQYFEVLFFKIPFFLMNEELWFYLFIIGVLSNRWLMPLWQMPTSQANTEQTSDKYTLNQRISALKDSLVDHPASVGALVGILYVGGHFLLFPLNDTRFFVGPFFIATLAALASPTIRASRLS